MAQRTEKRVLGPSTALYPVPAVVVTCGDYAGESNALTLAWVGQVASEPPQVVIGVRPTRYSYGLIQRYGDFVINLPKASQVDIVKYCGSVSGRSENKFEKAGLTKERPENVRAPLIAEFPVNIECRVRERLALGSHDLFLGEILAVHVDPSILTDGEVDVKKADPLAYFKGLYFRLGELIEK